MEDSHSGILKIMSNSAQLLQKRLKAWLLPVIWATLIFFLSGQSNLPKPDEPLLNYLFMKSAHMFVYGVLYFLVYRAVNINQTELRKKNWLVPLVICVIYSAFDELHQAFTPGRHPNVRDIGYDSMGMIIAFLRIYRYI